MGTIKKGILGGVSGKVGTIVGVHWKSSYYIRAHAAKVSNPRTPKQQEQRGKFATVFGFLKTIKPFIRIGYKEIYASLDGEYDLDRARYIIKRDTRHFAKRQITWFKREKDVTWMNYPDYNKSQAEMLDAMLKMIKERGIIKR